MNAGVQMRRPRSLTSAAVVAQERYTDEEIAKCFTYQNPKYSGKQGLAEDHQGPSSTKHSSLTTTCK